MMIMPPSTLIWNVISNSVVTEIQPEGDSHCPDDKVSSVILILISN